jgi:hypothetical protein
MGESLEANLRQTATCLHQAAKTTPCSSSNRPRRPVWWRRRCPHRPQPTARSIRCSALAGRPGEIYVPRCRLVHGGPAEVLVGGRDIPSSIRASARREDSRNHGVGRGMPPHHRTKRLLAAADAAGVRSGLRAASCRAIFSADITLDRDGLRALLATSRPLPAELSAWRHAMKVDTEVGTRRDHLAGPGSRCSTVPYSLYGRTTRCWAGTS